MRLHREKKTESEVRMVDIDTNFVGWGVRRKGL
jgi:hypothetical protein